MDDVDAWECTGNPNINTSVCGDAGLTAVYGGALTRADFVTTTSDFPIDDSGVNGATTTQGQIYFISPPPTNIYGYYCNDDTYNGEGGWVDSATTIAYILDTLEYVIHEDNISWNNLPNWSYE